MSYVNLVHSIAAASGQHPDVVRAVLMAIPDALRQIPEGQMVRTPMGVYRQTRKRGRTIRTPDDIQATVSECLVVRLNPGCRLRGPG